MSLEGSDFDTLLAVYTGAAVNALTLVGRNDECNLEGIIYSISCLAFPITTGTTYSLQVDGYAYTRGHVEVYLDFSDSIAPPGNDAFSAAASIMSLPTMGTTLGATMESGEPQAGLGASGSVWFRFTAPVASTTAQARVVDVLASPCDTVFFFALIAFQSDLHRVDNLTRTMVVGKSPS